MIYKLNTNVVPSISVPEIFQAKGKSWINFGSNNTYPQLITELYNKSSINRTCINAKATAIFGNGLKTDAEKDLYILNRINDFESWNDVFEKAILDYTIYGGFALNIIWTRDGTKIHSIKHIPFGDVRSGEFEGNKVKKYYYSSNWNNFKKHKPIEYNTFDKTLANQFPSQIFYYYDYNPGSRYYPLPEYSGSLSDIHIDIETSTLHLANLQNGLVPSMVINFHEGVPTPEAQREIYANITNEFAGVDKTGKFLMTFSSSKESAPEILPLEAANDDFYLNLDARTKASILSGHRITSPLLLGIYAGGNGFSSNSDEIINAWGVFKATVINPTTRMLLKPMNMLMRNYGYEIELSVDPLNILEVAETQEAIN